MSLAIAQILAQLANRIAFEGLAVRFAVPALSGTALKCGQRNSLADFEPPRTATYSEPALLFCTRLGESLRRIRPEEGLGRASR